MYKNCSAAGLPPTKTECPVTDPFRSLLCLALTRSVAPDDLIESMPTPVCALRFGRPLFLSDGPLVTALALSI